MTTYATLLSTATNFSARSDLGAILPSLIQLAEDNIRRDVRTLDQQVDADLVVDSTGKVALPERFLEFRSVTLEPSGGFCNRQVTYHPLDKFSAIQGAYRRNTIFTISGGDVRILPIPTSPTTVTLKTVYWRAYPRLDDSTNTTNWLLQNHFDIYLNALMSHIYSYEMAQDMEVLWVSKYERSVNQLRDHETKKYRAAPLRRIPRRSY